MQDGLLTQTKKRTAQEQALFGKPSCCHFVHVLKRTSYETATLLANSFIVLSFSASVPPTELISLRRTCCIHRPGPSFAAVDINGGLRPARELRFWTSGKHFTPDPLRVGQHFRKHCRAIWSTRIGIDYSSWIASGHCSSSIRHLLEACADPHCPLHV